MAQSARGKEPKATVEAQDDPSATTTPGSLPSLDEIMAMTPRQRKALFDPRVVAKRRLERIQYDAEQRRAAEAKAAADKAAKARATIPGEQPPPGSPWAMAVSAWIKADRRHQMLKARESRMRKLRDHVMAQLAETINEPYLSERRARLARNAEALAIAEGQTMQAFEWASHCAQAAQAARDRHNRTDKRRGHSFI